MHRFTGNSGYRVEGSFVCSAVGLLGPSISLFAL
jgi:hypothetical protein